MKANIHPTYYPKAKVTCACGSTFSVGSTKEKIEVEICANCHPFYTGQEKLVDTLGRVEQFRAKVAKAQQFKATAAQTSKKSRKSSKARVLKKGL